MHRYLLFIFLCIIFYIYMNWSIKINLDSEWHKKENTGYAAAAFDFLWGEVRSQARRHMNHQVN